ncbi:TetR/AcrR family transcriptional regulator [Mycobacterium sp. SMC-2]|uniref:TetR/AcrR family transcriptional regulator n=1 Tax=Mycobacterium sp. SMC-2 TaxID=2857058 RepID=UPI0021B38AC9|nr:TetR/AcrR family transcriptional regulator [Mycobacterium sp. SMC-2]UXA06111.1 TetR/AcrR family transcriptional regulator [Mycobacterium sp. SMC-2]
MAPITPDGAPEPDARTALLDATERLMLGEGYAAVTSRRVAAEAGVNPGLVYYYFGPMDELFLEVFRRSAARSLDRQAEALASEQPLWALWDMIRDQTNTALNLEFLALGNHRKAVMAEMKEFSVRFRRLQFEGLSTILTRYGVDTTQWPAEAVMLLMDAAARFMGEERSYGLNLGHSQAVTVVERLIGQLEGKRRRRRKGR